MRAEQFISVRANHESSRQVISFMNRQKLNTSYAVISIGFVWHLCSEPDSYSCHVYCSCVSGMGGAQELQAYVERVGVEKNLWNSRKNLESRKDPLH